jgi:hypothetical protein
MPRDCRDPGLMWLFGFPGGDGWFAGMCGLRGRVLVAFLSHTWSEDPRVEARYRFVPAPCRALPLNT